MIEHKPTFCRICEPLCGMIGTVEDGRLVSLRPDKEHPLSSDCACQKGIAFAEVHNDPDRVTEPMRRGPRGFEPVSGDEAMTDIAARLTTIYRRHGSGAVGWYMGNPAAFSYSHLLWLQAFVKGLGRDTHYFTASSQDTNSRLIASQLLYGTPTSVPIPDLTRTDFLVLMGANPFVSHGSFLTAPRIKDRLHEIIKRGGRVLVIDPRKTETAAQFEWLGIVPDADAYLLLSLLHVLFAEDLADRDRARRQADGVEWLQGLAEPFTREATAAHTGIEPADVRSLARDLATTPRAAIYGRFGTSVGRNATLTTYLIDAVNLVAGNLDRPGGRTDVLNEVVAYRRGRIRLVHDDIADEVAALTRREVPEGFPLRMIGMREPRSENSWMHNSPLLMRGGRGHHALMHVDDAAELQIGDGEEVQVSSPYGRITVPVTATKDLVAGVIAIPHGWGHKGTGGCQLANRAGGANVNQLMSSAPEHVESLSGMSWLTGVPVRVDRVKSASMAHKVE